MIENIPYPRLLAGSNYPERRILPIKVSLNLTLTPLSYASIQLPSDEMLPARGYVELFTCMGSAGIFRVRSPQNAYGDETTSAELEHAIVEVGDYLVKHKYNEMMSAKTAMQTAFSHYGGSLWQLGSVNALGNGQIAFKAEYDNVLSVMLSILEQKTDCMMAFDFTTVPWTVSIVKRGTTVTAVGRLSRNMSSVRISYDDSELCTRVYYEKPVKQSGKDQTETEWDYVTASSTYTDKYGIIEKEVSTGSDFTAAEALRVANEYLDKHKEPTVSIEISGEELSNTTGELLDAFTVGKLCRIALPDYNELIVEKNIIQLAFTDVYGNPTSITVSLADEEDTTITYIHDVDKKGGSGGGGGGSKKQRDTETKKFYTDLINTDTQIGMVIGTNDGKYKVLGGQIVLAINEDGGTTATIDADCIDISGVVVNINASEDLVITAPHIDIQGIVDSLDAYDITVETLTTEGTITVNGEAQFNGGADFNDTDVTGIVNLTADYATFDSLTLDGYDGVWDSVSIYHITTTSSNQYFLYGASYTSTTPTGAIYGSIVTGATTTTINYLKQDI